MTSEATEDRRRQRYTPRCNREWRENATNHRRRDDERREKRATAREAQADVRAREAREQTIAPSL